MILLVTAFSDFLQGNNYFKLMNHLQLFSYTFAFEIKSTLMSVNIPRIGPEKPERARSECCDDASSFAFRWCIFYSSDSSDFSRNIKTQLT